jgi:hypothetical protein
MTFPKLLAILSLTLFMTIGGIALFKRPDEPSRVQMTPVNVLEVELDKEIQSIFPALGHSEVAIRSATTGEIKIPSREIELPEADRIEELFNKNEPKLPIVETITYKSHVPWQKGRPAWLSDYATHYETSRHFIARSLNGQPNYLKQELAEGDRFNVLRKDKHFQFYLLVDTSRCKMWFYYVDLDTKEKVLLKTYRVGLGRLDSSKTSGLLTPLGKYTLGNRVATYKLDVMGNYQGKKIEMMTVFGTRWIPFEKEIGPCTAQAKGFGLHGVPWKENKNGHLAENTDSIGKYESDGCIRLTTADVEELFAIVITKPTIIEIVRDFSEALVAE